MPCLHLPRGRRCRRRGSRYSGSITPRSYRSRLSMDFRKPSSFGISSSPHTLPMTGAGSMLSSNQFARSKPCEQIRGTKTKRTRATIVLVKDEKLRVMRLMLRTNSLLGKPSAAFSILINQAPMNSRTVSRLCHHFARQHTGFHTMFSDESLLRMGKANIRRPHVERVH